ncbi:transposase family protein [Micrococcaceae bacterium Sec5.7]
MSNSTSCPEGHRCDLADAMFNIDGIHISAAVAGSGDTLLLDVESDATITGCPDCGVVAIGHGRRRVQLHDIPCFGRPVRLVRAKRTWRCPDADCPRSTFTETQCWPGRKRN